MKIALLQFCAGPDKAANLAKALTLSREAIAGGGEFILLPEIFNFRGDGRDKEAFLKAAEKIPGPSTDAFVRLVETTRRVVSTDTRRVVSGDNVSFLLGSILEKASGAHAYNTSVFIDPRGTIVAKYRKIHLFDARINDKIIREADCLRPGTRPVTVKIGKFKAGLSVCYDLRFPDLYQNYGRRGVEILTVPSCFTKKTGEPHWETLLRARAIENLSYVLAPNQVGMDARGMQAYGHSMIISPWGEVIACGSAEGQEIIFGEIKMEEVRRARKILPGIVNNKEHRCTRAHEHRI